MTPRRTRVALLSVATLAPLWVQCKTASPMQTYGDAGKLAPAPLASVSIDAAPAEAALAALDAKDPGAALAARRRLAFVRAHEDELSTWIVPFLRRYLPKGAGLEAHLRLDVGLPAMIAVQNDVVLLDVASVGWGPDDESMWNAVIRAIYRPALERVLADATPPADDTAGPARAAVAAVDTIDLLLKRVMVEGLTNFVAAQGRRAGTGRLDYRLGSERGDLTDRFTALGDATRALAAPTQDKAARTAVLGSLEAADEKVAVFGVVGAAMADAIERDQGREALALIIEKGALGPRAFYAAYQKTGPGALLNFNVPAANEDAADVEPSAAH